MLYLCFVTIFITSLRASDPVFTPPIPAQIDLTVDLNQYTLIDFESGILPAGFTTADWYITSANALDGSYSARAGPIGHSGRTTM